MENNDEITQHNKEEVEELLKEARAYLEELQKHPRFGSMEITLRLNSHAGDGSGKLFGQILVKSQNDTSKIK